ncbi:MAG: glycosyltransferase family 39 protein [Bryobacteraceae bacterium]
MTRAAIAAAASCAFAVATGAVFVPLTGIAQDEALFSGGIWGAPTAMLMPYVGATKSWLYKPLYAAISPGVWSVRMPMVLTAAVAVWLLWIASRRALGGFAAACSAVLAATDAVFLLTATYDWGPVALQHLFALATAACFLRFRTTGGAAWLFAAAFAAGLGLWDKALFVWILTGAAGATLAVYPRALRLNPRAAAIALAALLLGAAPLIRYNIRNPWATLRGNVAGDTNDLRGKANLMHWTLDGRALKGWFAAEAGDLPASPLPWLCLATLAGLPWLGERRRPAMWCILAFAIGWLPMLITARTGGAAHHTILLWPLPACLASCGLAALADRGWARTAIAMAAVTCLANIAVLNAYHRDLTTNGPAQPWTDAIFVLADRVRTERPPLAIADDWGINEPLRLLTAGHIPIAIGYGGEPAPVGNPAALHISFVPGRENFPAPPHEGYRRIVQAVIPDNRGNPVYEIYRLVP